MLSKQLQLKLESIEEPQLIKLNYHMHSLYFIINFAHPNAKLLRSRVALTTEECLAGKEFVKHVCQICA